MFFCFKDQKEAAEAEARARIYQVKPCDLGK